MNKKVCLLLIVLIPVITGFSIGALPHDTKVVSKRAFVNQVGPVPDTVLYTPSQDGDFRISLYISSPSCGFNGGALNVLQTWTDDFVTWQSHAVAGLFCDGNPQPMFGGGVSTIHATAGNPISIEVQANDTSDTYNLYMVVERL